LDKSSGLRIGLRTSIYKTDSEITEQVDSITGNPENYSQDYNFRLSAQYLHELLTYKDFALVIGGGPFAGYNKTETIMDEISNSFVRRISRNDEAFEYGVDLIAAAEYRLADNVIISGEYGINITIENADIENVQRYTYTNGNPDRFNKEQGTSNRFFLSGTGVNLGIAVFF
jgi:hypothetical protein